MNEPALGPYLRFVRETAAMSLRDVERSSDGRIKSGYLSQLERGEIRRPSPRILWILGEVLDVDYGELLGRAGYDMPSAVSTVPALHGLPMKAIGKLNDAERQLVRQFVEMLAKNHPDP
jgi:transcriptional regulator with XRE-family HTH domain